MNSVQRETGVLVSQPCMNGPLVTKISAIQWMEKNKYF